MTEEDKIGKVDTHIDWITESDGFCIDLIESEFKIQRTGNEKRYDDLKKTCQLAWTSAFVMAVKNSYRKLKEYEKKIVKESD